jgi:hypothetical protein
MGVRWNFRQNNRIAGQRLRISPSTLAVMVTRDARECARRLKSGKCGNTARRSGQFHCLRRRSVCSDDDGLS